MRKCVAWLVFFTVFVGLTVNAYAAPQVGAQTAALIEQSTGRVLWQSGGDTQLPMASTTKIMTALCVLENNDLDDVVTIDSRMVGIEGSSIYLEVGEELTVRELLLGLMLRSGNDAAVALALHTSGSIEDFAQLMNDTAAQLGLENTRFVNPHGLPAQGHYTTAIELGRITCAAYEYLDFADIVSTKRAVIPWKGHDYSRAMLNKNKMLTQYDGGNGVKTGFTKAAGRCLVSGAKREEMQLVAVVLNAPDMWNDSMKMLDYGYKNYSMTEVISNLEPLASLPCTFSSETVPVLPAYSVSVPLAADEQPIIEICLDENIATSVARGDVLGYATIGVENEILDVVPLIAGVALQQPTILRYPQCLKKVMQHWFIQTRIQE